MLEKLTAQPLKERVFRYSNQQDEVDFLEGMDLGKDAIAEIVELLRERQEMDSLESLIDKPFKPKLQFEKQQSVSRYSDGSIRIFYSALERETAEEEIKHHIKKNLTLRAVKPRTVYLLRFFCNFDGFAKDLRKHLDEWPWLTHDSDLSMCHCIAREAVQEGLDGLLAPSARRKSGACLPVFKRTALSSPVSEEIIPFTFDPATGQFA
jgi:hypothetical protein